MSKKKICAGVRTVKTNRLSEKHLKKKNVFPKTFKNSPKFPISERQLTAQ
jgi:hypothetical protein